MITISNINELQNIVLKLEGFKLNNLDGEMILGYLEGHDYEIKTNEKNLFIIDIHDKTDIYKETLLDIIYRVQNWNMELIENTKYEMDKIYSTLDDHKNFVRLMSSLLELKNDEKKIDELILSLNKNSINAKYKK